MTLKMAMMNISTMGELFMNCQHYCQSLLFSAILSATFRLIRYYLPFFFSCSGKKVGWSEEQEEELRQLYMENQNNPSTEQGKKQKRKSRRNLFDFKLDFVYETYNGAQYRIESHFHGYGPH